MTGEAQLRPEGASLVAGETRRGERTFTATDPRTGGSGAIRFHEAGRREVEDAVGAAAEAAQPLARLGLAETASMLEAIAAELDDYAGDIVAGADAETALGPQRLTSELARTTGQFRFLASVVRAGTHLEAMIDPADPDSTPPRPDLRRMLVPRGPVAVFGASNFPLAFSVPGGDTASALAAGCPVVAKGHPAHPGTSELCARAITVALERSHAPRGAFSMLHGGVEVGRAIVSHPAVAAVGFTGSEAGGRALFDLAASRPVPVPVYAEMGSLNPVFITPAALAARGEEIARGFTDSMLLGNGQFCTKPGIGVLPSSEGRFAEQVAEAVRDRDAGYLLHPGIRDGLVAAMEGVAGLEGVEVVAGRAGGDGLRYPPTVIRASGRTFLQTPQLLEERFGPVSVLVECGSVEDMMDVARRMPGSLTATVHAEPKELEAIAPLLEILRRTAGRIVFNGYPTGVAVTHAMHHGGPYPATTDSHHTSVGAAAISRWLRAVCYQGTPQELLPEPLRDTNPLGIPRLVRGHWTTEPLTT